MEDFTLIRVMRLVDQTANHGPIHQPITNQHTNQISEREQAHILKTICNLVSFCLPCNSRYHLVTHPHCILETL